MKRIASVLAGIVLAGLTSGVVFAAPSERARGPEKIEGTYIVVYEKSVERPAAATKGLERAEGFQARFSYGHAIKGFSAQLTPGQVNALERNPKVDFISADRPVEAAGSVPITTGDAAPTGVRRIEAATTSSAHEASSVNVAVVDSGIDLSHPDLNAVHGINCAGTGPATDGNGHGTHVAGTIGAKNNGAGVIGVAPGTKLYSAKVLDASGNGTTASVICGIDWVTSTRTDADTTNDIAVANMSLGGGGDPVRPCSTTTDAEHLAICRSTAAGVTYVVAAGNDSWDFDYAPVPDLPAAFPEVLTVTAAGDGDGKPGGTTKPSCSSTAVDDAFADYSNFALTSAGAAHTIAGPGTCIRSTTPGGNYGNSTGTSMATPHIAGAVALCLEEAGVAGPCSGMTPAQIIAKMRADAAARPASYGFYGDPSRPVSNKYYGYMGYVGMESPVVEPSDPPPPSDTTAPVVTSTSPAGGTTGVGTSVPSSIVSVTFNEEMDHSSVESAFSLKRTSDGSSVSGTFSWIDTTLKFAPSASLDQGTDYTARVGATAPDLAGNQLGSAKIWTFKTITNVSAAPSSTSILWGKLRAGTYARLSAYDGSLFQVNSSTKNPFGTSWYGKFTGVPNSLRDLKLSYVGKNSRICAQTVSLYNWAKATWMTFDSQSVGNTPVHIEKVVSASPADYVSGSTGTGELRMRVRCETNSGTFFSSGDVMRILYGKP